MKEHEKQYSYSNLQHKGQWSLYMLLKTKLGSQQSQKVNKSGSGQPKI